MVELLLELHPKAFTSHLGSGECKEKDGDGHQSIQEKPERSPRNM